MKLFTTLMLLCSAAIAFGQAGGRGPVREETVNGHGCYTYGDDDTPRKARSGALANAMDEAIRSYHVFVQSATTVKLSALENDVVESASAGLLHNVRTEDEPIAGRTVCVRVTATVDPKEMEALLQQKIKASQIAQTASTPVAAPTPAFGLEVSLNKKDSYLEGEQMVISVQSDRDAYLKLDYFQADGSVVHLVPNVFNGEAFIRAGRTYSFGGPSSPEKFVVQAPFGKELVKAIASTSPMDAALKPTTVQEDSATYLTGLQGTFRGLRMARSSDAAAWAEKSVEVVTVSKAAAQHHTAKQ